MVTKLAAKNSLQPSPSASRPSASAGVLPWALQAVPADKHYRLLFQTRHERQRAHGRRAEAVTPAFTPGPGTPHSSSHQGPAGRCILELPEKRGGGTAAGYRKNPLFEKTQC